MLCDIIPQKMCTNITHWIGKQKQTKVKDSTKAQLQQVQPMSFIGATYRSMGKGERKRSRNGSKPATSLITHLSINGRLWKTGTHAQPDSSSTGWGVSPLVAQWNRIKSCS